MSKTHATPSLNSNPFDLVKQKAISGLLEKISWEFALERI
jgi:hypothetical protein